MTLMNINSTNEITNEKANGAVADYLFDLEVAGARVPGALWLPQGAQGPRPLLLLGHGGGQHKLFPPLVEAGRRYAAEHGFAVAAIDAPAHGARATPEHSALASAVMRAQFAAGGALGGEALAMMGAWSDQAVPEWRAVIDALQARATIGSSAGVAYVGMSLGSMIGIRLAAADARIAAAVFGLVGVAGAGGALAEAARRVKAPLEFTLQWDDALVPRQDGLALYDAFGSAQKSLHVNPGGHAEIPPFERAGWTGFLLRHLGEGRRA